MASAKFLYKYRHSEIGRKDLCKNTYGSELVIREKP